MITPYSPPLRTFFSNENQVIIKRILFHLYPSCPSSSNIKSYIKLRLVCKIFNEIFNTIHDFQLMPLEWDKIATTLVIYKFSFYSALEKENYLEALILAKLLDEKKIITRLIFLKGSSYKCQKKRYSDLQFTRYAQKHIISVLGYNKALEITRFIREDLKEFAYNAFIFEGCKAINLTINSSLNEVIKAQKHPFINSLKKVSKPYEIPQQGVEYFIQFLVNFALGIGYVTEPTNESSSEDCEVKITLELLDEKEARNAIAIDLISLLPSNICWDKLEGGELLSDYLAKEGIQLSL